MLKPQGKAEKEGLELSKSSLISLTHIMFILRVTTEKQESGGSDLNGKEKTISKNKEVRR